MICDVQQGKLEVEGQKGKICMKRKTIAYNGKRKSKAKKRMVEKGN